MATAKERKRAKKSLRNWRVLEHGNKDTLLIKKNKKPDCNR